MRKINSLALLFIVLAGTVFQIMPMVRSGRLYSFGVGYWGPLARDGVWHEALSAALTRTFPPVNPGFAGSGLINYHYFYDLIIAGTHFLTKLPIAFLIYQLYPVIFSLAIGFLAYLLAIRLFKDRVTALTAVFFIYFGSSFGWVVSLVKGEQIGGESAFWANQPVSMNLNPPFAVSLVIVAVIIFLLDLYLTRPAKKYALPLIFLAATLIGFKVYAGVLVLGALFLLSLRRKSLLVISVPAGIIALGLFFLEAKNSVKLLEFNPFWLVHTMIDAGDRVGIPNFTARRFAYTGGQKWLQLALLETVSFLIFFVGNLGTRMISVFGIRKQFFKNDSHLFIFFMTSIAILLPLVFVQKGNAWNIIQFFYYVLFFGSFYAAFAAVSIFRKLPRVAGYLFIAVLILVTPISSVAAFRSWLYPNPPAKVSREEFEALKFLSTQPQGIILTHPFDPRLRAKFVDPYPIYAYADSAYVSALANKDVFLEDLEQQIVLGIDYQSRLADSKTFFEEKVGLWGSDFLASNRIAYIYLLKVFSLPRAETELPIKKIFENTEVNIYKVVQ